MHSLLKQVCDSIEKKQLTIKQVATAFDVNRTGYLARSEFIDFLRSLVPEMELMQARVLSQYFDDKGAGKISTTEFSRVVMDILNTKIGGGIYAHM